VNGERGFRFCSLACQKQFEQNPDPAATGSPQLVQ